MPHGGDALTPYECTHLGHVHFEIIFQILNLHNFLSTTSFSQILYRWNRVDETYKTSTIVDMFWAKKKSKFLHALYENFKFDKTIL